MTDPTITLGGKAYTIPPLAIRQNRHVEVLAARHRDYFLKVSQAGAAGLDLTDSEAEDFTRIVYHALTRALPQLTFEEFDGWEFSMRDILVALPVCLAQSGLFRPAAEPAPPPGESPPSTGTGS